jgi:hypothetical protein
LASKVEIDGIEHPGRLRRRGRLCIGDADAGSHQDKRVDKAEACNAPFF